MTAHQNGKFEQIAQAIAPRGMLILERHGLAFTKEDVRDAWPHHLPIRTTFGPERTLLLKAGIDTLAGRDGDLEE
jgi:hypothetical protein